MGIAIAIAVVMGLGFAGAVAQHHKAAVKNTQLTHQVVYLKKHQTPVVTHIDGVQLQNLAAKKK